MNDFPHMVRVSEPNRKTLAKLLSKAGPVSATSLTNHIISEYGIPAYRTIRTKPALRPFTRRAKV